MTESTAEAATDLPPPTIAPPTRDLSCWRVGAEIALFSIFLLLAFWKAWQLLPGPTEHVWVRGVFIGGAVIVVIVALATPIQRLDEVGLSLATWREGWGVLIAFTALSLGGIVAVTVVEKSWDLAWERTWWAVQYVPGVMAQQFAMQAFINNRVYWASRSLAVTIVFGTLLMVGLHVPNIPLSVGVLITTPFWLWHFRRYQNLPALIVSHAILGTASMFLLGKPMLVNLRVGMGAWELMVKQGW